MTVLVGPPYVKVGLEGAVERVRRCDTSGAIESLNYQHIAGDVHAVALIQALTPPISIPRGEAGYVQIDANFTLTSHLYAAALPGYARAELVLRLFAAPLSRPAESQSVRSTAYGRFTAPLFTGTGMDFPYTPLMVSLTFKQDARRTVPYVIVAGVESWVGCFGWAMAEATVRSGQLENVAITTS